MKKKDQFCSYCDVTMDLHPDADDGDEWACAVAEVKANMLERFGGLVPR